MSLNRAKEFLDQSNLLGSHVFRIWKLTMTGKERLCITEFVCFLFLFFFDRGLFFYIYFFDRAHRRPSGVFPVAGLLAFACCKH